MLIFMCIATILHSLFCCVNLANTLPIHLGRQPEDECTSSISCSSCPVFEDILVSFPDDATLRVNIGPSGQDTGYTGITGVC